MFGNPGSTELPMLADFPDDFRYVLGLQEAVAVGMADGYAQASGTVGHVNLHTAPGVGQRDGGDLQRAGEPHAAAGHRRPAGPRAHDDAGEPDQPRRDARSRTRWSSGATSRPAPPTSRRRSAARSTPRDCRRAGPRSSRSRWTTGPRRPTRPAPRRRSPGGSGATPPPAPDSIAQLARHLESATNPVLVAGPDIDASGGWDSAVALAERLRLPVWAIPATGGGRLGFPEGHDNFRGLLPPAIGPVAETLAGHDLILVVGASIFAYYPYLPGDLLPDGAVLVGDHLRSRGGRPRPDGLRDRRRPRRWRSPPSSRRRASPTASAPEPRPAPADPPELEGGAISGTEAMARPGASAFPDDGFIVLEAPSSTVALRNQLRISRPEQLPTSAPAAGSASASPPRSAHSSRCPTARSSASSARARRSTRSPPSGAPPPTTCRSPSSSCATPSTRSSSGSRWRRGSRTPPASTCRRSTSPRSPRATACPPAGSRPGEELRAALGEEIGSGKPSAGRGRGRPRHVAGVGTQPTRRAAPRPEADPPRPARPVAERRSRARRSSPPGPPSRSPPSCARSSARTGCSAAPAT